MTLCPARSAFPLTSTVRLTSITVPAGRAPARAGAGIAGGGPAGAAPRIRSSARSSASRLDGTVLTSRPPMLTWTVTSSAQTRAACPARAGPILSRWTRGSTLSTPAGEITVSNSTASPDGDRTRRGTGPAAAAGSACARGRRGGLPVRGDAGAEQAGGGGHVQGLVRPGVVIGVHPGADRRLG